MADKDDVLKEDDEQLEIVEVDEIPPNGQDTTPAPAGDEGDADGDGEDHLDDDDPDAERLAQDRDDPDDKTPAAEKRRKRRQLQKEARDRTLREVDFLRRQNTELSDRVARLEGVTVTGRKDTIGKDLAKAKSDLTALDTVLAKAIEAGNGDDAAAALRLRDETRDQITQLENQQKLLDTPEKPRLDPQIASLANEWQASNPWYGTNPAATAIAKRIDGDLAAEGWDPKSEDYWSELSKRVERRFRQQSQDDGETRQRGNGRERQEQRREEPARRGPPLGGRSQNGGAEGGNKVFVTPERKAAMQEAGIWDDPVRRTRALKEYADFDRNNAARN